MIDPANQPATSTSSTTPKRRGVPEFGSARVGLLRRWLRLPVLTLSTRVAVTAGFFVLASVAGFSFLLIRAQREQVLAEVVHGSESIPCGPK